jgi:hypothetical protein
LHPMVDGGRPDERDRNHHGQTHRQQGRGMRPAPAPFPPAFSQATVGDPFEGLVDQVAAEIPAKAFASG